MSDIEQHAITLADGRGSPPRLSAGSMLNVPLDSLSNGVHAPHADGAELRRLLEMMRGRWLWAFASASVGMLVGGMLGFRSGHKIYASTGQIRVVAVVPKVLYSVEDKDVPQMFDSFVDSQVALLQSQRVMELATQDPAWQPLGRPPSDAAVQNLMHSIEVVHSGELITVKATDLDPVVAVASVRSVVGAFEKIYEEGDAESNEKRLVVLENIQATKGNELNAIREEISNIARPYGTDNLQPLFNMKQSAVEGLETSISNLEDEMTTAARNRAGVRLPDQMTPEQWAAVSGDMAVLLHDRAGVQRELNLLRAENLLENNRQITDAKAMLDVDDKAIETLSTQLQAQRAAGLLPVPNTQAQRNGSNSGPMADPQNLREQIDNLHKRLDAAKVEMIAVGDQQLKISDLKYKEDQSIHERDAAQQRINQLNTEATINGRVTIISAGDRPLAPYKDSHITLAAAGGFGGGLLGFAAVAGLALLDRRLRSPLETGTLSPELALLGLLPRLPEDPTDTAHDSRAAHCVTGVRNLLQMSGRSAERRTFVITSPIPAAGKTSLTFALGVSYATARCRTLMIDCDLVGGGLTARAEKTVTRKIGQMLIRDCGLTNAQVKDALVASRSQNRRLGEIVVERGWLSQADLDRVLVSQQENQVGLLDVLDGLPLHHCVAETGVPNLRLLPIGKASSRDVPLLSAQVLKKLIESARKHYDIVLIDTGPIPGSLEAQLVAAVVDAAVVVVTPGMRRSLIRDCIDRLDHVGAKVAGLVYNRASESEVFVYTSGSQPPNGRALEFSSKTSDILRSHLGPLASAVTRVAPASKSARHSEKFVNGTVVTPPENHDGPA